MGVLVRVGPVVNVGVAVGGVPVGVGMTHISHPAGVAVGVCVGVLVGVDVGVGVGVFVGVFVGVLVGVFVGVLVGVGVGVFVGVAVGVTVDVLVGVLVCAAAHTDHRHNPAMRATRRMDYWKFTVRLIKPIVAVESSALNSRTRPTMRMPPLHAAVVHGTKADPL